MTTSLVKPADQPALIGDLHDAGADMINRLDDIEQAFAEVLAQIRTTRENVDRLLGMVDPKAANLGDSISAFAGRLRAVANAG